MFASCHPLAIIANHNCRQGKIKHIGLSSPSSNTLRRACAVEHVTAVQVEYSPCATQIERGGGNGFREPLLATCRELGVAVVAYSPLARGLLSGAIELSSPSSSTPAPAPAGSSVEDDANVGLDDKGAPDTGYASFAEGDVRVSYPRFAPSNLARNLCAVRTLHNEVAGPKGCSVGQLALAWLLAQGDVFPIPG